MATNRLPDTEQSENVGTLVKGIVTDLENLAQQHIRLLKQDLKEDFQKLKQGTLSMGIGLGIALVGVLLLGIALSEIVLKVFPDPQDAYRWAAYGIVGILVAGAGAAFLFFGEKEVESAAPIAEKTLEALEDDAKWLKQPK